MEELGIGIGIEIVSDGDSRFAFRFPFLGGVEGRIEEGWMGRTDDFVNYLSASDSVLGYWCESRFTRHRFVWQ